MRHVLIIEDQSTTAKALAEMAIHAGASSVAIASDEARAIAAAREHAPRIILSDVDLGSGGRGPNAVAAIQAAIGPVPAIFITGNPCEVPARTRATAILAKPITANRVQSILADVMATCPDPRPPAVIAAAHSKPSWAVEQVHAGLLRSSNQSMDGKHSASTLRPDFPSTEASGRNEPGNSELSHPHKLRGSQRFPTSLSAVLIINNRSHEVIIMDISAGGARIRCGCEIPPNSTIILNAGLERIPARLKWQTPKFVGLQFLRPISPLEIVRQANPQLRAIFHPQSATEGGNGT